MATNYPNLEIDWSSYKAGTFRGRPFKGDSELDEIAKRVVALLRVENLPIWQSKEVLKKASSLIDWEVLK